ncbi:hypothetical protein [Halobellus ruber]|uniref:Uncharacterized protein n=1 Tax=Halobellus ruber TaxID=2761102 RepID=A0A7J9SKN5_9EURY|nr:hypothetical protein [Halobellus ruber]MBB6646567.1 hypothetical protein [Halobellus ruber]
MSTAEPRAGIVTCPACDLHVPVTEPNEAVEVYRRHERVTGHGIEWERVALDVTASSPNVESMLETLDGEYDDGVPVGVLTAAAATREVPISAVLDELHALRMEGKIHEPIDDHFSPL